MDAEAKKKLFRAKLNAQKQEKRIDSPLVRYNEKGQPVCRVCDVVLKSDSLWPAHQVSRKHQEAVNNLKSNAAAKSEVKKDKSDIPKELPKSKPASYGELHQKPDPPLSKSRPSSTLPSDFFDNREMKRPKHGMDSTKLGDSTSVSAQTQVVEPNVSASKIGGFPISKALETSGSENQLPQQSKQSAKSNFGSDAKQVKGSIPEGFFDDKDSDLRARGITPVKPDVKDEYKEFEKLIQEDLQEIDNRLEEEEIDAAETIEEAETVEQRAYREKVQLLRQTKMEIKQARSSGTHNKAPEVTKEKARHEESSSDDDGDENFTVDWRAKHL